MVRGEPTKVNSSGVMTSVYFRGGEQTMANAYGQETGKIMQELGGRMMAVINKYAKDKGYSLVLDVSTMVLSGFQAAPMASTLRSCA